MTLLLLLLTQDARALTEKLRSDSIEERSTAVEKLKALGKAAAPEIEKLLKDSDAEVVGRARYLLRYYGIRERLPDAVHKAQPDLADRLASDDPKAATKAFLLIAKMDSPSREVLDFLAADAVRGADKTDDELAPLFGAILRHKLRSAAEAMIPLLEAENASLTFTTLAELKPVEQAPEIRKLADRKDRETRVYAVTLLGVLQDRASIPLLASLRSDPDSYVRSFAVQSLGMMAHAEAVPGAVDFLRDSEAHVRKTAVDALVSLKAGSAAGRIREMTKSDPDLPVRIAALVAMGALGGKEGVDDLIGLLDDPSEVIRAHACKALGASGSPASIPKLREVLRSPKIDLRVSAVRSLGRLKAREAAADVADQLKESDLRLRVAACEALEAIGTKEHVAAILVVARDRRPEPRTAAIKALVRLRASEGVPLFLDASAEDASLSLSDLNALRAPERWAALADTRVPVDPADPTALPGALEAAVGKIEGTLFENTAESTWPALIARLTQATPLRARPHSVSEILALIQGHLHVSVVLEHDRVRFLSPDRARAFWRDWWAAESKP